MGWEKRGKSQRVATALEQVKVLFEAKSLGWGLARWIWYQEKNFHGSGPE
ncbi:MAG TPA: hypothetical protein VIL31_08245 [Cyclobacteriaceae bacterium]|jgi:hypothetical protein